MRTLRVAIVGGGIGGLAAANALTNKGMDVGVYEQAHTLGEVGAGVGLGLNSVRLLERLGLGGRIDELGATVNAFEMRAHDGEVERVIGQEMAGALRGMYRPDLVTLLSEGLPKGTVHTGRRCVGLAQSDDHATILFADGIQVEADVIVAADGIHSTLQRHVVEPAAPVFSGTVAYRGVISAERLPEYPSGTQRAWMGPGKHFLVFPVHAGRLINYVGFVPSDAEMRESWSAPGDPAALAAEFAGWDTTLQQIISEVTTTFRWGLYDREPLSRWTQGRLTLLGDAAHPMLPHMGQGANQAIEDGVALATLLDGVDNGEAPQALLRYEALRRERTSQIQRDSRVNGIVLDSGRADNYDEIIRELVDRLMAVFPYDVEAHALAARKGSD